MHEYIATHTQRTLAAFLSFYAEQLPKPFVHMPHHSVASQAEGNPKLTLQALLPWNPRTGELVYGVCIVCYACLSCRIRFGAEIFARQDV